MLISSNMIFVTFQNLIENFHLWSWSHQDWNLKRASGVTLISLWLFSLMEQLKINIWSGNGWNTAVKLLSTLAWDSGLHHTQSFMIMITVLFVLIPSKVRQVFYLVLYCESQFETISSFSVSPPSIAFLPSRSAHLPPSPAPHLPAHLTISTSPFQQSEKERGLNQLKGGSGCPANQQKEKGEELKSAKERRRGWT